ncbi:MAG: M48 family peptidase [Gammaproteobacteria bacterium]|nr:MAG: M48 family peptidase [Gammaproteobacteria bacterium]
MSTDPHHIEVAGIGVEVVRKEIKNLHVGVYPPAGRVRVAAPLRLDDEAVRLAVVSHLAWIRRKQKEFEGQDRQSQRDMVSGESHYFQGRRLRLAVKERGGIPGVGLLGHTTLELRVPPAFDRVQRDAVLQRWYRRQLRALLPPLLAKWEPRVGKTIAEVRIKGMKTRWGSCNADAGRIWLNLELIKKPVACVEYVLVHEMVHLLERHHTERFQECMERLMPNWRLHREELNRAPLAHEEWKY